ncbi:MAG: carbon-nitrogen hydrolase family protein, partial [Armatimonadetes bacterium]|nr:carbon-nitrogen hydrolase family protein [Armatimonadota bacterium]
RTFGHWRTTVGGLKSEAWYRLGVSLRTDQVAAPAHEVCLKVTWVNARAEPLRMDYISRREPLADGWQRAEEVYRAPAGASGLELELSLRWTAGSVAFDEVTVTPAEPRPPRTIKVATVCFEPRSGGAEINRVLWAQQVDEAGKLGADLVCLGEGITVVGTGLGYLEVAEPVPGPTVEVLGEMARKHDLYIVAGVYEQEGRSCYNTALLIGPDGQLVGRYRKTHLPESEAAAGLTPGTTYPVFATRFGLVGMQVCYDNFFPEVARALAVNGAELICTPIWGDGRSEGLAWDLIPRARAIDNGVWFVASNYSQKRSLIVDPWGGVRADTKGEHGIAVCEINLDERRQQPWLSSRPGGYWEELYRQERRPTTYGDLLASPAAPGED